MPGNKNVRKKNDRNEVKITKTEIKNNETSINLIQASQNGEGTLGWASATVAKKCSDFQL